MFDGFSLSTMDVDGVRVRFRVGGSGPPLLLLHGHPQTHVMWHRVAPALAERFTVVASDLRGYGDSGAPPTTADHFPYSKRAMAVDQVRLMAELGFEKFLLAGHDRGGRCAYRLALDHAERVAALAVLDIVPTYDIFRRVDSAVAAGLWRWFLMAAPAPLPETMIAADPDAYYFGRWKDLFEPEALAEYLRCVRRPATIHSMCEDYRAAPTLDFEHDGADQGVKKIDCPVLVLWGQRSSMATWFDLPAVWRHWADDVEAHPVAAGHFLAEEAPEQTLAHLSAFFARHSGRVQAVSTPH